MLYYVFLQAVNLQDLNKADIKTQLDLWSIVHLTQVNSKIIHQEFFSDECKFQINCDVNKQNVRISDT